MAEDIKNLIEKIKQDGIQVAEEKAKDIESQAQHRAEAIIEKAEKQAQAIIAKAKVKVSKIEQSGKVSLKQAGRDLLLSLRKEINAMLDKLIISLVRKALSQEELIKLIKVLIKDFAGNERSQIVISLKKEDLERAKKSLLNYLRSETEKGIVLKSSEDIRAGFIISYDNGKSHYDFTDQALAEYIGQYLRPQLSKILAEAASCGGAKA